MENTMQIATLKGERTVAELAARLYKITGPGASDAAKQAADALLKANPALSNIDRLPVGSAIVIPDTPHLVNAGELITPTTLRPIESGTLVKTHVTVLTAALDAFVANPPQPDPLLSNATVVAAAQQNPALAQRLQSITGNAKATLDDLQAKQAMVRQALAQLQKDAAGLLAPGGT
jgi:hypothetical protein